MSTSLNLLGSARRVRLKEKLYVGVVESKYGIKCKKI